jgi:quercetin dioxygenase-like cupin family protein
VPFIDIDHVPPLQIFPGCRIRTPYGRNLMLSYVEIDAGGVVPEHSHPHEQAGYVLSGRVRFTIGGETRVLGAGDMFLIPPDVPHAVSAVGGPARVLDVFSPVREDYAAMTNRYISAPTPANPPLP